jgi:hypothetical protein
LVLPMSLTAMEVEEEEEEEEEVRLCPVLNRQ